MDEGRIYFDDNAGAPPRAAAVEAARAALVAGGNPSSVHDIGRNARRIVDGARDSIAALANADPADVIFASGASEANAMALDPALRVNGQYVTHCLASAIEHPSVLAGGRFGAGALVRIASGPDGVVSAEAVADALSRLPEGSMPLVCVMAANNETGVIQPIETIAQVVHAAGGILHCDAVQAAGRLDFAAATAGADIVAISGHKMGAPAGIGALVLRNDRVTFGTPLISGGGQERNRRAGTENVAGIAGLSVAAQDASKEQDVWSGICALRDWIESRIRTISPSAMVFGAAAERLANTICVAVPGSAAETAVIAFDLEGICLSSGSACSSGKVGPSHVLAAMGVADDLAQGALRISLPRDATRAQCERFVEVWEKVFGRRDEKRTAA